MRIPSIELRLSGTRLSIGLPIIIIATLFAIFGSLTQLLAILFALAIHETAHILVSRGLSANIKSIDIQPLGARITLQNDICSSGDECAIAAAGPLCSFFAACACMAVITVMPQLKPGLDAFIDMNMTLALVNLLPALPLDGGRILRALLSYLFTLRTATKIAAGIGIILGVCMCGAGGYLLVEGRVNPTLLGIGLLLLFSAIKDFRISSVRQFENITKKQKILRRGDIINVKNILIYKHLSAMSALSRIVPGRYNIFMVVDECMEVIGSISEQKLLDGIIKYGNTIEIGQLVDPNQTIC
jgi:stage IV sporulation protein FB